MKKIISSFILITVSYFGYSQCTTPIVAPWMDDVESHSATTNLTTSQCWTEISPSGPDWNIDGFGSTPSFDTGPSGAYSGTNYFYLETSFGVSGDEAELISPDIDISGLTNPALTFHYHMYGDAMAPLNIEIFDGTSWIPTHTVPVPQQTANADPWIQQVVSLTAFSGVIKIKFIGEKGTGTPAWTADVSLDDIGVIDCTPSYASMSVYTCGTAFAPSGKVLHAAGTVMDTIPNAIGCDSIITITVVTGNTFTSISPVACGVYTTPSGAVYGTSGVYLDTSANAAGCDSIITINLTVNNTVDTFSVIACNVYTAPSGATYSVTGTYNDTIPNSIGCDSIMTISVAMSFDYSITIFATICSGVYTSPSGMVYNSTGVYLENLGTTSAGCDSIRYIDLTSAAGNATVVDLDGCEFVEFEDSTHLVSTTENRTYSSETGCDSTVTYNITVNNVNSATSMIDAVTIKANETGASYQWYDCNTNMAIAGEITDTYVATVNGDYSVEVTKNNCTEMSGCVRVGSLGFDDEINVFSIYPNPSNGLFVVEMTDLTANTFVVITNVAGQEVYKSSINATKTNISINNVEAGVYFVSITNANGNARKTIVIE